MFMEKQSHRRRPLNASGRWFCFFIVISQLTPIYAIFQFASSGQFLVGLLHFEGVLGEFFDADHGGNFNTSLGQTISDLVIVPVAMFL